MKRKIATLIIQMVIRIALASWFLMVSYLFGKTRNRILDSRLPFSRLHSGGIESLDM